MLLEMLAMVPAWGHVHQSLGVQAHIVTWMSSTNFLFLLFNVPLCAGRGCRCETSSRWWCRGTWPRSRGRSSPRTAEEEEAAVREGAGRGEGGFHHTVFTTQFQKEKETVNLFPVSHPRCCTRRSQMERSQVSTPPLVCRLILFPPLTKCSFFFFVFFLHPQAFSAFKAATCWCHKDATSVHCRKEKDRQSFFFPELTWVDETAPALSHAKSLQRKGSKQLGSEFFFTSFLQEGTRPLSTCASLIRFLQLERTLQVWRTVALQWVDD